MTNAHFIDPSQFLADQLAAGESGSAAFDAVHVHAGADGRRRRRGLQRRVRPTHRRSGPTPATATATAIWTPGPATSSWRFRNCGRARYFPDWLLEPRKRAEKALTSVVATCYLLGVSTRRMDKLVQSLGISGLSRSQVSVMAKRSRRAGRGVPATAAWTRPRTRSSPPTRWC